MTRRQMISHRFVDYIPEELTEGVLYVSIPFATSLHKCCCGCGNEVVTPLDPADWKVIFDGKSVSLRPSIGNWTFDCQSHYLIRQNCVIWLPTWTEDRSTKAIRVGGSKTFHIKALKDHLPKWLKSLLRQPTPSRDKNAGMD